MSTPANPRPVESVNNAELYDRWAKVYDTDGNILQAIDDHMLPQLINKIDYSAIQGDSLTITELGCGTGRNTIKLLPTASSILTFPKKDSGLNHVAQIYALDLSRGMLEIAEERYETAQLLTTCDVKFYEFDALQPQKNPEVLTTIAGAADLVLSTLVLEHLPLDVFFTTVKQLLKPGGWLVLTNMHEEMGKVSQAGFVDETRGQKVRGTSYVYSVTEVMEAAEKEGLCVCGGMEERGITTEDIEMEVVGERAKKWIGTKVWFGCVMQHRGEQAQ